MALVSPLAELFPAGSSNHRVAGYRYGDHHVFVFLLFVIISIIITARRGCSHGGLL
jgi:hypothetical protein